MPREAPTDQIAKALGITTTRFSAYLGIAGAGIVASPLLAAWAIDSGLADVVVSYFGVKFGSDEGGPYAFNSHDPTKRDFEMPLGWYGQPVYFAAIAQRYRHDYGLQPEQTAEVAIAARHHACLTPGAMMRTEMTLGDYLSARMIAEPLRVSDCCLLTDGAAAIVMTSLDRARDLPHPPIVVAGGALSTSDDTQGNYFSQKTGYLETPAAQSGPKAFESARLTPMDVSFAQIYDCFTISTILQLEDLGFCKKGEGGAYVEGGRIRLGGELPVNTHGGLLSHSYVLGVHHIVEAVEQLRGVRGEAQVEDAQVGLVTGLGVPDHSTLLLTKDHN
jgi:acetyl-CoA acetyltransferase